MVKVKDFTEILTDIKFIKEKNKGYVTNFYPEVDKVNIWITNGKLYKELIGNTMFFFNQKANFFHLFYCSSSIQALESSILELNSLEQDIQLVVDVIGKKESLKSMVRKFKENGFYLYTVLNRMSRFTVPEQSKSSSDIIKNADISDAKTIFNLFQKYFDPIAEQLPTENEIINWINLNHLIIAREVEQIQGFVIFDLIGVTSYLRYWFVHPEYRDRKIGSTLLKEYFKKSVGTKRQLFWVIQSNENAISRYLYYGFRHENLNDYILTNKNISYETANN
jgi:ribosomal protein S18 acetylase RimI-like enzyme